MAKSIKVASFLEAFNKFLSYSDGGLGINTLASFAKLKEAKKITFSNEDVFWDGNHSRSSSSVELLLVEYPCVFYIVKFHYSEISRNSHSSCEISVFIPDE